MKWGWLRRLLILCAAAALCWGMVRWSKKEEEKPLPAPGSLRVWYAESDCPSAVMEALLARCREQTGLWLEITAFPDEAALRAAFAESAPDLFYCSHIRAGRLSRQGKLGALDASPAGAEAARVIGDWIGLSFFPLGSRLPVLLYDSDKIPGSFESLEALYAAGGNSPFLVSDDWAELLFTTLYSTGYTMCGDKTDADSAAWREAYNALAAAVFQGGFVTVQASAADYVRAGAVPCAVTSSAKLAGLTDTNLRAALLPLPAGAAAQYPVELMGFALFSGADIGAADAFARWLCDSGDGGAQALAAGLVPLSMELSGQNGLERDFAEIAKSGVLFCLPPDTVFYENRPDCERQLGEALDLLT